jgi:hypothetical protein
MQADFEKFSGFADRRKKFSVLTAISREWTRLIKIQREFGMTGETVEPWRSKESKNFTVSLPGLGVFGLEKSFWPFPAINLSQAVPRKQVELGILVLEGPTDSYRPEPRS